MKRPQKGTYPNSHVFPGGVSEKNDPSLGFTALRETYEETGLFIAPNSSALVHPIGHYQAYEDALRSVGVLTNSLNWSDNALNVRKFTRWVTPPTYKKRFSTQFFVYKVPQGFDLTGVKSDEAEILEWLTPDETLDRFSQGTLTLMPPQFYLVTAIKEFGLEGAIEQLSQRVFEPNQLYKSPDGFIQHLDWGKGEIGEISRDKRGMIRNISKL